MDDKKDPYLSMNIKHLSQVGGTLLAIIFLVSCQPPPDTDLQTTSSPTKGESTALRPFSSSTPPMTTERNTPKVKSSPDSPDGIDPSATPNSRTTPSVQETGVSPDPPLTVEKETASVPSAWPDPLPPGALIRVSIDSQVGVLLDEIPDSMRDPVIEYLLERPDDYWLSLAERQVRLARLRLNFRNFQGEEKGQLPLPPEKLWSVELDPSGPRLQTILNHELIMIGYTFSSVLLTDAESPGLTEPVLAEIGGTWLEPFVFPADPDFLLQRTGNACINEGGFPPESFDSENAGELYDFTCQANSGGETGCHRTFLPDLSCRQALTARIGEIETAVRFERIPWDNQLADQVRIGPFTNPKAPDLMVVSNDLKTNRIIYRYVQPDNCAIIEESVGDAGWRRLLLFDATVHNVGGTELHIGPVVVEDLENNVFDYSLCHNHFHYSHYGDFSLDGASQVLSSKQAFCVQSTDRYSNNEFSPLIHDYRCRFQGIQVGWVDEYSAGLDSQWIDITDVEILPEGIEVTLGFTSNGDQFLCEGFPEFDEAGEFVWEPSGFLTEDGESINRPKCEFIEGWEENNQAFLPLFIPQKGSFVTMPCVNDEIGPLRNCGFTEYLPQNQTSSLACAPGTPVNLTLELEEADVPTVVRVCERSEVLGVGVACTFEDAVSNTIITSVDPQVRFSCPRVLDSEGFKGGYSIYTTSLYPTTSP